MSTRLDAEPSTTTFVYIVEGEPYVGTLYSYAKALEQACYAGIAVEPVIFAWEEETWKSVTPIVKVGAFDSATTSQP